LKKPKFTEEEGKVSTSSIRAHGDFREGLYRTTTYMREERGGLEKEHEVYLLSLARVYPDLGKKSV